MFCLFCQVRLQRSSSPLRVCLFLETGRSCSWRPEVPVPGHRKSLFLETGSSCSWTPEVPVLGHRKFLFLDTGSSCSWTPDVHVSAKRAWCIRIHGNSTLKLQVSEVSQKLQMPKMWTQVLSSGHSTTPLPVGSRTHVVVMVTRVSASEVAWVRRERPTHGVCHRGRVDQVFSPSVNCFCCFR